MDLQITKSKITFAPTFRKPRMPARKPVVTITDGSLLTVERVAEDASLLIEILRDGELFFSTNTMEHSVAIPYLEPGHTYTITSPSTAPSGPAPTATDPN